MRNSRSILIILPLTGLLLAGCGSLEKPPATTSAAYNTAISPSNWIGDRIEAARSLSDDEKVKLSKALTDGLPGDWDVETRNAIHVLGAIGDPSVIPKLEALTTMKVPVPGQISTAIYLSVHQIKCRANGEQFDADEFHRKLRGR